MATKDYSSKQEHMIADYLGWSVVSGSGSRNFNPGDVRSTNWLGECKTHTEPQDQIVFYKSVWNKIQQEALSVFKQPVLFVDDGTQKISHTWCVFNSDTTGLQSNLVIAAQYKFKTNIRLDTVRLSEILHNSSINPVIAVDFSGMNGYVANLIVYKSLIGG